MKVSSGGETGADTDFALINRGESLAGLVKPLSVASLQLGHLLPKSVVTQFLLLFPHAELCGTLGTALTVLRPPQ